MTNFIKKFFSIVFVLVIVQVCAIGFLSLISGDPINTIAEAMSIYEVKTVQIGTQQQTFLIMNIRAYLQSISKSITVNLDAFNILQPPSFNPDWSGPVEAIKSVFNIIIYGIDWIIYIVNLIVLGPLKLLLTPFTFIYSLLGVDLNNLYIVNVINAIYTATIPYIPMI